MKYTSEKVFTTLSDVYVIMNSKISSSFMLSDV